MSATKLSDYETRYEHVDLAREGGILQVRLHTNDGPLVWGAGPHSELGACFDDIGRDRENRVVILTGSGDRFCTRGDQSWLGAMTAEKWDVIYHDGKRLLMDLLGIEVPVISAINGPARIHAELALLSDIVLASETTYFQDGSHFTLGIVPGDGVHVVWQELLGLNRGRYFLLTNQRLSATEALELGVVSEVLPPDQVLKRAWVLARELAVQADTTLRYTRVALTQAIKSRLLNELGYGLALEGLNAHATWPRD